MYRYFIFDMDGTLLDSTDGIIAALQEMEKRMGLAPLSMAELRGFIGPPLKESFIKYYGAAPEETDEMTRVYRDCYLDVGTDKTRVFDGAFELLRKYARWAIKAPLQRSSSTSSPQKPCSQQVWISLPIIYAWIWTTPSQTKQG